MDRLKRGGAYGAAALGTAVTMVLFMAGAASATPPDPVETAFGDMQGKVTTYGAATVALVVAVVVLFFGIKFLKRGSNKA